MIAHLDQIEAHLLALPRSDRAHLAERLLGSLDDEQEAIDTAWKVEIERRVAEWRQGKVQAIPGEDVLLELTRELDRVS